MCLLLFLVEVTDSGRYCKRERSIRDARYKLYRSVLFGAVWFLKDQLLGRESDVTLIYETIQRYPLALIDIDSQILLDKLMLYAWKVRCMIL